MRRIRCKLHHRTWHSRVCSVRSILCIIAIIVLFTWNFRKTFELNKSDNLYFQNSYSFDDNWTNILQDLLYSSNVCLYKKPKTAILVTSHVQNFEVRKILRQSYPQDLFRKYSVQMIFLLANVPNETVKHLTNNEFRIHGDIIQGNFLENYRNLTLKHLMGYNWISRFCSSVEYVVKMDDDITINYYKLFEIINKYKPKSQFLGCLIRNPKPERNHSSKWYVSESEYKDEFYPNFVSGWMYITTLDTVNSILKSIKRSHYFWIDDTFVTGLLREKTTAKIIDLRRFFKFTPDSVLCCISRQYTCDFLAAPNYNKFDLNSKLHSHLWQCRHQKLCRSETKELRKYQLFPKVACP